MRSAGAAFGLGVLALLGGGAYRPLAGTEAAARPSLLLVTLDTTRADRLGCYGARDAATPNLDAVAAAGTRFDRALAPVPLTLPSHATLLTGRVPRRHQVRDNAGFRLDPHTPTLAERLREAGYLTAACVSSAVLDRVSGLARGFETYDDAVDAPAGPFPGERVASRTVEAALARLERLSPPFFLWIHFFDPHDPYAPPEPWRTRFRDRLYDGEIAYMDAEFGKLLRAVRARASDRLLVVVAGDHGESLGEHGEATHGVFLYQATQRVPLLLAGPDIPQGSVVTETVGLVDAAPTLLALLGLPALPAADGRSLRDLLQKERADPEREPALYELETFYPAFAYGWAPLRGLVRGHWKYIEAPEPEAYDLLADPEERRNLWRERPEWAAALARELSQRAEAQLPRAQPESEARRAQLESLGYLSGASGGTRDPKRGIRSLASFERARQALAAGQAEEAARLLEPLLAAQPGNRRAWLLLAQCRLAMDRAPEAADAARRALELWSADPQAHLVLANALARLDGANEKNADPASHYEQALGLNPRYVQAYLNYASWALRERGPQASREILERARRAALEHADIEFELGLLAKLRGDRKEARRAFEKTLELDPEAVQAWIELAELAYAENDPARAARLYARALELRPSAETAKTLGAILLHRLGDRSGALQAFRRALELTSPGDPDRATLESLVQELESRVP